ncbi:helix-turn-helix domain-containing protein [Aromatoleum evansii]|nr:helix-turn-helix domain-containing protein [Aromatoleum evansii]
MIGERIKEERQRLGLNQTEFAALAGAAKRTQIDWEKGASSPTAEQLAAIATAGADVQYIVTGTRRGEGIGLPAVQQAVLNAVDLLSLEKKIDAAQLAAAVVKLLAAEVRPAAAAVAPVERYEGSKQVFNGPVGDVAGRDILKTGRKRKE